MTGKKNNKGFYKFDKFEKKNIPNLRYGMIHSQFGYPDGVSIVMKQVEHVMVNDLEIPKKNIFYLVGKSKVKNPYVIRRDILWDGNSTNKVMLKRFSEGYGGQYNEKIEKSIEAAKDHIKNFVEKKKIDILIVHNASLPVNFISSIALSRYYRDSIKENKKTPKYILWWHDAHTERQEYKNPSSDVYEYLIEGVPGKYVEYILFINSTQFSSAEEYFLDLDKRQPGYYKAIDFNHDIVYNTTDTFIDSYEDLNSDNLERRISHFLDDFKIPQHLENKGLSLKDAFFVLQHTRVVPRKRIDFALRYCFELYKKLCKGKNSYKAMYFFVSGHTGYKSKRTRRKLLLLHKRLLKEYGYKNLYLVFAEDCKTDIKFEEYPRIFAKLGGISTYFSEIEGFGNNLLEVLASGLIPVVYTYPVFKKDIAKFKFKTICLNKFEIDEDSINKTYDVIKNKRKRKIWVNRNLKILKKNFKHQIIARKLKRAIIRRRLHK
ncbi:MAG: hypothetical protein ACQER9_01170 [Nanobdellota archaeon]